MGEASSRENGRGLRVLITKHMEMRERLTSEGCCRYLCYNIWSPKSGYEPDDAESQSGSNPSLHARENPAVTSATPSVGRYAPSGTSAEVWWRAAPGCKHLPLLLLQRSRGRVSHAWRLLPAAPGLNWAAGMGGDKLPQQVPNLFGYSSTSLV